MIGMNAKLWGAAALIAGAPLFAETPAGQPPSSPSSGSGQEEPQGEMAGNLLSGTLMPQIPSNISITNDGPIRVEKARKIIFEGPRVHMVTDTGVEVFADYAQADMDRSRVFLKGNLSIYQSDSKTRTNSLIRASSAEFDLSLIHISEPTRLGMISYAVFCLKKKKTNSYLVCRLLLEQKKKKKQN